MHLYLKAVGLGSINTRKEYDKLIKHVIKESIEKALYSIRMCIISPEIVYIRLR